MSCVKKSTKIFCIVFSVLCFLLVFSGCNLGEEVFENGTLTINISGADEYNGKSFHYYIDTFLPADRALDDTRTFTGSEPIIDGLVAMTLEDPDSVGTDYLFKANNVITVFGYIDVDGNGMNHGGIDQEMNNMLEEAGGGNINGNKVITAVYPADFHLSESGSGNITLLKGDSTMVFHNADNNMGEVTVNVAKDFIFSIQNTGSALLNLEGTPLVALSGDSSAPFTVLIQPDSEPIIPNDTASFTIRVLVTSAGTYSATISIPFDDSNNDDPDTASPYTTTISVTASS